MVNCHALIAVWGFWLDGIFIGAVRTDMMQNTMLISAVLIFLPSWYFFHDMGNHGLWLAYTLFMATRGVALSWVYIRFNADKIWFTAHH